MFAKLNKNSYLGPILRPYVWRIWLLSGLSVLLSVLQVGMALIFRSVIDAVLAHREDALLWSVLLVADLVLQVGVYALYKGYAASIADKLTAVLRLRLLDSAVNCEDSRLEGFHSGQLLNRGMEDVRTLCDSVVNAIPDLIGQVTRLITAFAAVLLIYPVLAVVLLLLGTAMFAGIAVLRPVLKKRQRSVRESEEKVSSAMQEDLQQLVLIQSLDAQEQILKRFDKRLKLNLKDKFSLRCWNVGTITIINSASMLGTGALLLWGAAKVAAGVLSYGSLTSLIQLLNQFRAPVLSLSGLWTRFVSIEVSAERLTELLEISQADNGQTQSFQPKAVIFENVTFGYAGEEAPVLKNFSLRLPMDGWTCLVGFSGRGKTTLFKLILGLYTPQEGSVYLETDQGKIPCGRNTRHLFAYVPQDYALFSGTVLENLQLVAPDADEATRRSALALACADFVWEMNAGENTPLRENNTGLSKGQIQRLAIARALLMERPVLLLDECTSALDADTENSVLRNLQSTGKKVIMVTHRPEALGELDGVTAVSMDK